MSSKNKSGKVLVWILIIFVVLILLIGLVRIAKYRRANQVNEIPNTEKITSSGTYSFSVQTSDGSRPYDMYVPSSYINSKKYPVVFVFHGGAGDKNKAKSYITSSDAEKGNFIAVYPEGLDEFKAIKGVQGAWNAGTCCGDSSKNNVDDVGYTEKILSEISNKLSIDSERVYATGISNGGMFVYKLACDSSKFKAVASVAGTIAEESCNPASGISILHIHAKDDQNVLFTGGCGPNCISNHDHKSVQYTLDFWRNKLSCQDQGQIIYSQGNAECTSYSCSSNSQLEFCIADTGGHSWLTTSSISATEQILEFFDLG